MNIFERCICTWRPQLGRAVQTLGVAVAMTIGIGVTSTADAQSMSIQSSKPAESTSMKVETTKSNNDVDVAQPEATSRTVTGPTNSITNVRLSDEGEMAAGGVCGAGAGPCCEANGTPGCDDEACCGCICGCDPFCCDVSWDSLCAGDGIDGFCGASNPESPCTAECSFCLDDDDPDPKGCVGDLDGDGVTGVGDLIFLVDCIGSDDPGCEAADLNGDGVVNWLDLLVLLEDWGCTDLPPQCGDDDAGDCCEPNGSTACDNLECCEQICAADPFCCETEWDGLCADAANDPETGCEICQDPELCGPGAGDCCAANGTPGCEDVACCECICGCDPFCCDVSWDSLCGGDGIDGLCGASNPAGPCADECSFCQPEPGCGVGGTGNCCEANDTPFCDDLECCNLICDQDPFCCETEWDGLCADAANDEETGCVVCQPDVACGPDAGDCCSANGTPGCEDVTCCNCICNCDPFCCDVEWDGICAGDGIDGFCGASNPNGTCVNECSLCFPDPACGVEGTGNCCAANGTPYCDNEECCEQICAQDAFCCDTEWDGLCADAANDPDTGCDICQPFACPDGSVDEGEPCGEDVNGGCNSTPPIFSEIECGTPICGNAWASGGTRDTDWFEIVTTETAEYTFCVTAEFATLFGLVAGPGDGDCGNIEGVVDPAGFGDPDVETCVTVTLGPGTWWWFVAPSFFDGMPCPGGGYVATLTCEGVEADCGVPGTGNCCEANGTPYCDDAECCEQICAEDPFCCETEWDGLCADAANDEETGCGVCFEPACGVSGTGDCCEANGTPFCDDEDCCDLICAQDAFCCNVSWDGLCAGAANDQCEVCGVEPACGVVGTGDCCSANDTPFCDDADCCNQVCADDPFCCEEEWDGLCAEAAVDQCAVCAPVCGPNAGACCSANGTPGCEDEACCDCICGCDPFCCDVSWDTLCAGSGVDGICGASNPDGPCASECDFCIDPDASNCCAPHGGVGCDDPDCEALICGQDAFCCDVEWDGLCAGAAQDQCAVCQ